MFECMILGLPQFHVLHEVSAAQILFNATLNLDLTFFVSNSTLENVSITVRRGSVGGSRMRNAIRVEIVSRLIKR